MRRRRGIVSRLLLVSLFGACLLGAPAFAGAETTTSVHVPRHRSAESLLPVARAALGEEGSATVDGDALILVGSPDAVERTADLLRARDRAQPLITLEVESRTERWLRAAGYEIRWESTATDFALGRLAGPASGPQRGRISAAAATSDSVP